MTPRPSATPRREVRSGGKLTNDVFATSRALTGSGGRSTDSANKEKPPQRGCRVGGPGARRGKTCRRHSLLHAMALGPGLVLAEVAGSMFCPLTPSRRLRLFAPPARPAAAARQMSSSPAHFAPRQYHARRPGRFAAVNHRERRDAWRSRKRTGRRAIRVAGAKK